MKTCWKKWLKAAAVRAVKTVAQTAVATIGTSAAMNQVDWVKGVYHSNVDITPVCGARISLKKATFVIRQK